MKSKPKVAIALLSGVLVGFAGAAHAKRAPVTIQVVGQSNATILVNGKPYVAGAALPRSARVVVKGDATLKIGDATVTVVGGAAEFKVSGGNVSVLAGQLSVTSASGQTQVVSKGQSAAVAAPAAASQGNEAPESVPAITTPPLPPPTPKQNQQVAPVSPSSP